MSLRHLDPGEVPALISELAPGQEGSGPAAFGEVAIHDMSLDRPRGLAVGECVGGRWTALAYAVPHPGAATWTMEIAIDPTRHDAATTISASAADLASREAGDLILWLHDPRLSVDPAEFALQRSLHKMSAPLPRGQHAAWPEGFRVAGFRTGEDEDAWLDVNNRAFAGHPEQSGWTTADVLQRLATEWFDPDGLRMVWQGDRLVAFNWTKIHMGEPDVEGEIYVIAVDPDFGGLGLGRAVTLEGLRHMHADRGAGRATLYVEESNARAMRLYESIGFTSIEVHRALRYLANP